MWCVSGVGKGGGDYCWWWWTGDVPSARLLERGTEPVSRTVSMPTVRSAKPRVREK